MARKSVEEVEEKVGASVVGVYATSPTGVVTLLRTYEANNPSHNVVNTKGERSEQVPFTAKAEEFCKKLRKQEESKPEIFRRTFEVKKVK